jgi:hypothetical protein
MLSRLLLSLPMLVCLFWAVFFCPPQATIAPSTVSMTRKRFIAIILFYQRNLHRIPLTTKSKWGVAASGIDKYLDILFFLFTFVELK